MITITPNSKKAYTTKAFLKKASIYGTREYELLKKFLLENEGFTVEAKTKRKAMNKNTNATYENMKNYLKIFYVGNIDSKEAKEHEKVKEFEKIVSLSKINPNPYKFVCSWFDATYPNARSAFEAEKVKETSESEDAALSA